MYLLYLDESGDPYSWDQYDTFVLGGVAVFEGEVDRLAYSLDEVQKRFFPDIAVPLTFHASQIHSGRGRFREMPPEDRDQLMRDVYNIIADVKWPGLVTFATAIDVSWIEPGKDACIGAFEDICRMFNGFLIRQFKRGHPDKGLLILDPSGRETRYRECIADYRAHGTSWGYIGNIVDIPYFAHAKETRMMQLADFCAYAVFVYHERDKREFLDMIYPQFERREGEGVYGLNHITA